MTEWDAYGSHMPVTEAILTAVQPEMVIEFGTGQFSTPALAAVAHKLISVEQQNQHYHERAMKEYKGSLSVIPLWMPGVEAALTFLAEWEGEFDLVFIDGSTESFKVGKNIDLSQVSLNDSVRVVVTEAIAIDFYKPE